MQDTGCISMKRLSYESPGTTPKRETKRSKSLSQLDPSLKQGGRGLFRSCSDEQPMEHDGASQANDEKIPLTSPADDGACLPIPSTVVEDGRAANGGNSNNPSEAKHAEIEMPSSSTGKTCDPESAVTEMRQLSVSSDSDNPELWPQELRPIKSKRRRSSFLPGRADLHLPVLSPNELLKDIADSGTVTEKVRALHRLAIEIALTNCAKEIPNIDEFQKFSKLVSEKTNVVLERILHGDLGKGLQTHRAQSSTVDENLLSMKDALEADLKRFQLESSEWETILCERQESCEISKKKVKGDIPPIKDARNCLSPEQLSFLNSRPDYNKALIDLKIMEEQTTLAENAIMFTINQLKKTTAAAGKVLQECSEGLYRDTNGLPSPRKLIDACISLDQTHSPVSEPNAS